MSEIAKRLQAKKDRRNELDSMIAELDRRRRSTTDPGYRVELANSIERHEAEYQQLEDAITALEQQRLPEKSAEELQKRLIEAWQSSCHRVDYLHTLNQMQPILQQIGNLEGGTAIFLIPEGKRMHSKWLLKCVAEWIEQQQNSRYICRPLSISSLDSSSVLTELATAFGVSPCESIDAAIHAVADAIYESISDDDVVFALELSIRLPKLSFDLFHRFLHWFLGSVWQVLVENHPLVAQDRTFLRVVIFLLTDLKLQQLPEGICIEAPHYLCDKCTVVRISPWAENDVINWVHKFSRLKEVGCQTQALSNFGSEAHGVGGGIPLTTWACLHELLHEELTCRIEEMKHGELATLPVSR